MTNADLIRGMSDEELAIILPCPNKAVIAIKVVKTYIWMRLSVSVIGMMALIAQDAVFAGSKKS